MINFDEEIKNFKPSLEVTRIEDAIVKADITDMQDIMMNLMKEQTKETADGYSD